mgnify:CR=1 FL=1|tara:strand:- start:1855 stop:2487 length:633 start_codon:yes stop_codon:yes gene_type:complete
MSEIVKLSQDNIDSVSDRLKSLTKQHSNISDRVTPKAYIKKKMGLDYVEIGYMKALADQEFPGWSWEIINSEALGSEAYVVHGRLRWYDNGVMRTGDMVAAHRIQKKRNSDTFVDVGNDIKSANTDCMKKALNMYMNIADDVYRNQYEDPELSDEQVREITVLAKSISDDKYIEIDTLIAEKKLNALNFKGSMAKLNREKLAKGDSLIEE